MRRKSDVRSLQPRGIPEQKDWLAVPSERPSGGCSFSEERAGRSLAAQSRRSVCARASVAFAAHPAGSSFLGRSDPCAMESYDVIANQPVVIDNVSCLFALSKGTCALLPETMAFRCPAWVAGSLSLAQRPVRRGSASAASVFSPFPTPSVQVGRLASHRGTEDSGGYGKSCSVSPLLGPMGPRGLAAPRARCPPSPRCPMMLLGAAAVHLRC